MGLERAFQVILQRRRLNAGAALRWGLADFRAPDQETALREIESKYKDLFVTQGKRVRERLPLRTWRQRFLEGTKLSRWLLFRGVARVLRRRVPDDMPAPWEALRAIEVGQRHGIAAGLCGSVKRLGAWRSRRQRAT